MDETREVFGGLAGGVDGDDLAGDRVLVLEPGVPDGAAFDLEVARERIAELEGGEFALLDEEEDVLAFASGVVEGDFFNEEILGAGFEGASDAGDVGGEVSRGIGSGGERVG